MTKTATRSYTRFGKFDIGKLGISAENPSVINKEVLRCCGQYV